VARIKRAPGTYLTDSEESEAEEEPAAQEEVETEEAILERAVAQKDAAAAKKTADLILQAKKQVRFAVTPAPPQDIPSTSTDPQPTPAAAAPSQTATAKPEIWKAVKTRSNAKTHPPASESDRACWLYIYNHVSRENSTRRYVGDREQWKTVLKKQLGKDFALVTDCVRVRAPLRENRLVIECPSKSSRR
jgi:hypothetical protein